MGARQHQRRPGRQPDRVRRDAPQGRRRAVVGEPGRARLRRRGARRRSPRPGRCGCSATPSPTPCTCATTSSPTSGRSRRRARLSNGVLVLRAVPRLHRPAGRRPGQRPAHLPAAAVRAHRAHRVARPVRRARHGSRGARSGRGATSRGCRTGSRAVTSGTCGHPGIPSPRASPVPVLGGPSGIGTQGARIALSLAATAPQRLRSFTHVPFQPAGGLEYPAMDVPFPLTLSPHLEAARERNVQLVR